MLLQNDIVILENVRYGNAIYIFYEDWQVLSKLTKIELRNEDSRKFDRISHSPNWKNFVIAAIS